MNLSSRQVRDANLLADVAAAQADSGLAAGTLSLEMTESILLDDSTGAPETLEALRHLGVRVMLDDFGTGYSSMGYLQSLKLDALKIDRSFVSGLGNGGSSTTIVQAMIVMARGLGMEVVPEGVETPRQAEILHDLGCRRAQGYLFGKPMPIDELRAWLQAPSKVAGMLQLAG